MLSFCASVLTMKGIFSTLRRTQSLSSLKNFFFGNWVNFTQKRCACIQRRLARSKFALDGQRLLLGSNGLWGSRCWSLWCHSIQLDVLDPRARGSWKMKGFAWGFWKRWQSLTWCFQEGLSLRSRDRNCGIVLWAMTCGPGRLLPGGSRHLWIFLRKICEG